MGVDARGFPGGLLRLDPALAYVDAVSDEVRREAQGAFRVAPGKSGLHGTCMSSVSCTDRQILHHLWHLESPTLTISVFKSRLLSLFALGLSSEFPSLQKTVTYFIYF